jgi:hypothetical protein
MHFFLLVRRVNGRNLAENQLLMVETMEAPFISKAASLYDMSSVFALPPALSKPHYS